MTEARKKVIVGLSGGVDSAVAAALLLERGHRVEGLFLRLPAFGTSGADAARNPERVADVLEIRLHTVDARRDFEQRVLSPFVEEYSNGRTPNPCVLCNRRVKFPLLRRVAEASGAPSIATGHYARTYRDPSTGLRALAVGGGDRDQSYFLYGLTREQLEGTLFPLGELNKQEVRRIAEQMGLPVHDRPDSQDLCFLAGGRYREFLRERRPRAFRSGPIVHVSGEVIGEHDGIGSYTVGQRRGLGVARSEPLYVVGLHPEENAVVVGERPHLRRKAITVGGLNWVSIAPPERPVSASVKIRYNHPGAPARVRPVGDGRAEITFEEPQEAPCPGQAAVFYRGELVLGGGTIEQTSAGVEPQ